MCVRWFEHHCLSLYTILYEIICLHFNFFREVKNSNAVAKLRSQTNTTTTAKPANMALMTEKNELKDVFAKLNRHPPAAPKKQSEVHRAHVTDEIILELEPEDEQRKGHLAGEVYSIQMILSCVCLIKCWV